MQKEIGQSILIMQLMMENIYTSTKNFILELGDVMKLINIEAPCTATLKQTCPLMNVLNKYKSPKNEVQYELDFQYLEPFMTYVLFQREAIIFLLIII
jgi:hypothetical protein